MQYQRLFGTVVVGALPVEGRVMKRCPVCQRRYSKATQFCTRDGTPLDNNSIEALRVVNHCKLCNKFYPQADGICPVHGIPIAEDLSEPEQTAPQTREIEKTENTLYAVTSMRVFGFNSDDRRLITTLAILTTLLLLSLGVYSLTRPAKSENLGSYSDLVSSESTSESDRQQIELSDTSVSEQPPLSVSPSSSATSTLERPQQPVATNVKTSSDSQPTQIQKPINGTDSKTSRATTVQTSPQTSQATISQPTAPETTSQSRNSSSTESLAASSSTVTEAKPVRRDTPVENTRPSKFKGINPRLQVTGKTRREIEDGYIYEFDLVVKEATGIRWHSVSGNKVTYGGRNTPIKTVQLEPTPDGSLRCHVSVKMAGRSVEDWYGQVYTTTTGIDEDGKTVRIDQDILLDESFPIIGQVTRR